MVIPCSQWRRRFNNDTLVLSIRSKMASRTELGQAFGRKKGINLFLKPAPPIEPSRGINQTSNAGKPEASVTGTNPFSCSERRPFHPRASEVKGTLDNTGENIADPICPVETASLLPDDQQVTTSPPSPVKEESDVTLNDADILDSIARALFDVLQENRTGNQLPAMRISLARVGWRQNGTIRFDHPRCTRCPPQKYVYNHFAQIMRRRSRRIDAGRSFPPSFADYVTGRSSTVCNI